MTLLSCEKISKSFGDLEVLREVNFEVQNGEKIGIVGNNGAGKTTLLDVIQGRLEQDSGRVRFYNDRVRLAYLLQSADYKLIDYNKGVFSELEPCEENGFALNDFLKTSAYMGIDKAGSWEEEQLANLSGGERTKLALSKLWSFKPDILILDEPTNHMDFKGVEWLVGELESYCGTCIIVSHDRYFLDRTVNHILELEDGIVNDFGGNYTFYREEKRRRYEEQLKRFYLQEEYKKKIGDEILTLKNWSHSAHKDARRKAIASGNKFGGKEYNRAKAKKMDIQIKSRIKRLQKLEVEGVEKPKEERKMDFCFESVDKSGKRLLEGKDISKSFSGRLIFDRSSFYVCRGEKIGVIGPNGCGKTTLLKLILETEFSDSGELWMSQNAKLAYLSQQNKEAEGGIKLIELLKSLYPNRTDLIRARNLLSSMDIDESRVNTTFNALSYGERVRVRIANMILGDNNFLILDEPTNHLDLHSREKLEEALTNYSGTVLFVSHDRYAISRVCQKLLVFEDMKIKRYEGTFEEYMKQGICVEALKSKSKKSKATDIMIDKNKQMLLELKIARIIGKLSMISEKDEEYTILDREYKQLMVEKEC